MMKPHEHAVYLVLRKIATQRRPDLPPLEDSQTLTYDLGLSSLDLARAVVTLEYELKVDPFVHKSITSIRTVGDLCEAYQPQNGCATGPSRPLVEDSTGREAVRRRGMHDALAETRRHVRGS
jgi:acyl carrier protein